jgi:putative (di)nucleoside polyphosphate hydrolase
VIGDFSCRRRFSVPDDISKQVSKLLADPLIQMVMRADGVTEGQLLETLNGLFAGLSRGAAPPARSNAITRLYRPSVGIMLLNSENKAFVGKRRHTEGEAWQMPQGGIEKGEDVLTAAYRELLEEVGTSDAHVIAESKSWLFYDLPPSLPTKPAGGWRGQRQKWFAMRFTGTDADINIDTVDPEFSEWKWVDLIDLPGLIVSFKRLVYLSVLEEFSGRI